jgi:hypothetical protein
MYDPYQVEALANSVHVHAALGVQHRPGFSEIAWRYADLADSDSVPCGAFIQRNESAAWRLDLQSSGKSLPQFGAEGVEWFSELEEYRDGSSR